MTELATACRAGHCTACGRLVWRTATARRNNGPSIRAGMTVILWPQPDSVYARLETSDGEAPGIAFCADCRPAPGDLVLEGFGPVRSVETAHNRYERWFATEWGVFRRAWLRDAFSLEPQEIDALMSQWEADRPLIVHG